MSAYLFGSFAEGRQHADSDIDIGVLLDRDRFASESERFEQRLHLSSALSLVHGPKADVVILNDAPATLGRAIITRGKRLLCNDAGKDHAFVRDVQLQAPDLEMWMQRMRARQLRHRSSPVARAAQQSDLRRAVYRRRAHDGRAVAPSLSR